MKKGVFKVLFVGALASLIAIPLHAQESALDLTLDQALEIALSENLTVQVADMEVTKTGYARKGTYCGSFSAGEFQCRLSAYHKETGDVHGGPVICSGQGQYMVYRFHQRLHASYFRAVVEKYPGYGARCGIGCRAGRVLLVRIS